VQLFVNVAAVGAVIAHTSSPFDIAALEFLAARGPGN